MWGWCIDGWAWWWIMPLVGVALCIIMCVFFRAKMGNRCFGCFPNADSADPAEIKKESGKLKVDKENTKIRKGE